MAEEKNIAERTAEQIFGSKLVNQVQNQQQNTGGASSGEGQQGAGSSSDSSDSLQENFAEVQQELNQQLSSGGSDTDTSDDSDDGSESDVKPGEVTGASMESDTRDVVNAQGETVQEGTMTESAAAEQAEDNTDMEQTKTQTEEINPFEQQAISQGALTTQGAKQQNVTKISRDTGGKGQGQITALGERGQPMFLTRSGKFEAQREIENRKQHLQRLRQDLREDYSLGEQVQATIDGQQRKLTAEKFIGDIGRRINQLQEKKRSLLVSASMQPSLPEDAGAEQDDGINIEPMDVDTSFAEEFSEGAGQISNAIGQFGDIAQDITQTQPFTVRTRTDPTPTQYPGTFTTTTFKDPTTSFKDFQREATELFDASSTFVKGTKNVLPLQEIGKITGQAYEQYGPNIGPGQEEAVPGSLSNLNQGVPQQIPDADSAAVLTKTGGFTESAIGQGLAEIPILTLGTGTVAGGAASKASEAGVAASGAMLASSLASGGEKQVTALSKPGNFVSEVAEESLPDPIPGGLIASVSSLNLPIDKALNQVAPGRFVTGDFKEPFSRTVQIERTGSTTEGQQVSGEGEIAAVAKTEDGRVTDVAGTGNLAVASVDVPQGTGEITVTEVQKTRTGVIEDKLGMEFPGFFKERSPTRETKVSEAEGGSFATSGGEEMDLPAGTIVREEQITPPTLGRTRKGSVGGGSTQQDTAEVQPPSVTEENFVPEFIRDGPDTGFDTSPDEAPTVLPFEGQSFDESFGVEEQQRDFPGQEERQVPEEQQFIGFVEEPVPAFEERTSVREQTRNEPATQQRLTPLEQQFQQHPSQMEEEQGSDAEFPGMMEEEEGAGSLFGLEFAPSLEARVFDIEDTVDQDQVFTGFELRPLPEIEDAEPPI